MPVKIAAHPRCLCAPPSPALSPLCPLPLHPLLWMLSVVISPIRLLHVVWYWSWCLQATGQEPVSLST